MFNLYKVSTDHYTIDWEVFDFIGESCDYESQELEVMDCYINITKKTMTCTLSVQEFTDMKVERGFSTQALFQACVDLAQDLELEKIVYIHDRYSAASLQLAAILDKSAEKISKEYYNEVEFFWYEITNYIYIV